MLRAVLRCPPASGSALDAWGLAGADHEGRRAAACGPSLRTAALKASTSLLTGLQGIKMSAVRGALVSGSAEVHRTRHDRP